VIVRTAKTEGGEPSLAESGVSITPQGSLTGSSKVTRSQVGFKSLLSNAFEVLSELVLTRLDCCTHAQVAAACRRPHIELPDVSNATYAASPLLPCFAHHA